MLYRSWINGKWFKTHDLSKLEGCDSIDIFIQGIWQVWS